MTKYEMIREALVQADGTHTLEIFEWEDGTSALYINFSDHSVYLEFDERGELCFCSSRSC